MILDQFLDFPQVLTRPQCKKAIIRSIKRYMWLLDGPIKLMPADQLTTGIIQEIQAHIHSRAHESGNYIIIGSIHVTGSTTNMLALKKEIPSINILVHPYESEPTAHLLTWKPTCENQLYSINDSYRRVGSKPIIAKGGWKFYKLPRYHPVTKEPLYPESPPKTYNAIQRTSRPIAKIGHWAYGPHHDVITINLIQAYNSEFDSVNLLAGSDLPAYVLSHLFEIFNIKSHHLTARGHEIFSRINKESIKSESGKRGRIVFKSPNNKRRILIYPSHFVTDHIVHSFTSLIADNKILSSVGSSIIPIIPIGDESQNSATLISGLAVERIRQAQEDASSRGGLEVYIFDDAVVSGRTRNELQCLLFNLGIFDVKSIAIIDRQRLPSAHYMMKKPLDQSFFWRFDWPSLGSPGACPLCSSLARISMLIDKISFRIYVDRLKEWMFIWAPKNPTVEWGEFGLRPQKITLEKPNKKFSVDIQVIGGASVTIQEGGDKNLIHIRNSLGLSSWAIELHTMTGRDDLPQTLLSDDNAHKQSISPHAKIQLLASHLLLYRGNHEIDKVIEVAKLILQSLSEIRGSDGHTSFASITLLSLDNEILFPVISEYLRMTKIIDILAKNNVDLEIFFTLAICRGYIFNDNESVKTTLHSRLKSQNMMEELYKFHIEVSGVRGPSHSTPLNNLLGGGAQPDALYSSLDYICSIAEKREFQHIIRCGKIAKCNSFDGNQIKNYEELYNDIFKQAKAARDILGERTSAINSTTKHPQNIELQKAGKSIKDQLSIIHNQLFAPIGLLKIVDNSSYDNGIMAALCRHLNAPLASNRIPEVAAITDDTLLAYDYSTSLDDDPFNDIRASLSRKFNETPIVIIDKSNIGTIERSLRYFKDKNFIELFVPFTREILNVILDVYSNLKHCCNIKTSNPWSKENEGVLAHMWIRLEIANAPTKLSLTFANHKCDSVSNLDRNRPNLARSLARMRLYGGGWSIDDSQSNKFFTTIELPFVHLLSSIEEV